MKTLLQRYIKGEVSEKERQEILLWLEESPEHMNEYMALRKLYDISLWSLSSEERQKKKINISLRRFTIEALKIAAILLIGIIGAWKLLYNSENLPQMQIVHAPAGQRLELILADGTKVWLNAGSTLKFPDHFRNNARDVILDGEGYFAVTHDKKRPFTVQTKKCAEHVLGTEFNVRAYNNSDFFETALIKGSVEVSIANMKNRLRLKPNEVLSMNKEEVTTGIISDHNYFKWKEGLFCFENETVGSLIEKLQIYYDVTIDVQNKSLLKYRYSGKFRIKDGVEHVLKVLQLEHNFNYTKDDRLNQITIK